MEQKELLHHIQGACAMGVQLLPPEVLCESIGSIGLKDPLTVELDTPLHHAIAMMKSKRIGSLVVVNPDRTIAGIFTERDCLMKVAGRESEFENRPIKEFMTPDPFRELPDVSIAYALNIMANGGFRHVPIVDQDDLPIGIISVKDVVAHIVNRMMNGIVDSVELAL
jgi:CBS domain-containing protein